MSAGFGKYTGNATGDTYESQERIVTVQNVKKNSFGNKRKPQNNMKIYFGFAVAVDRRKCETARQPREVLTRAGIEWQKGVLFLQPRRSASKRNCTVQWGA